MAAPVYAGSSPYPPDKQRLASQSLTNLRTVDDLNKKVDSLRRMRQPIENQWKLNLAF